MKRKLNLHKSYLKKAIISFILAFALLAGPFMPTIKVNKATALGSDEPMFTTMSAGMWCLEKLGGGILSGIAGKGVNEGFKAIFGSETDAVLAKLEEMSKKLDKIQDDLNTMIKQHATGHLNEILNNFQTFISSYEALYELLDAKRTAFANNPAATKEFLLDIYYGEKANYRIDGDNMLILTLKLTKRMLQVYDGKYNIFGAFDQLDRHIHKWEHQGYESRENFRDYVLTFYTQFMALCQLACQTAMEEAKEGSYLFEERKVELNRLKEDAKLIYQMNKRCAVIRHPKLRIFRDTTEGKDLFALHYKVDAVGMRDPKPNEDIGTVEFLNDTMVKSAGTFRVAPGNGGMEFISPQVWIGDLKHVHKAYGGTKTLYDILFDPKEGNFENVGNLPKGTEFATDYYIYGKYFKGNWITNLLTDKAQNHESVGLIYFEFAPALIVVNKTKYFSVIKYQPVVPQGSLKYEPTFPDSTTSGMISGMEESYNLPHASPVTLSVEEKAGATYKWFVDKTGSGFSFEEIAGERGRSYTLPTLAPEMNGYLYRCGIIEKEGTEEESTLFADPVTLKLTGEGVAQPITEHEVSSATELKEALKKVNDGIWSTHTLKLKRDILYTDLLNIHGDVTIDLGGHKLTVRPDADDEPNINPMSDDEKLAAVYVANGSLDIIGEGSLDVIAINGVKYGVYVGQTGNAKVSSIKAVGATGLYVTNGGIAEVTGTISTEGDWSYGVECFGGLVTVGNVFVDGNFAYGVYGDSTEGTVVNVTVEKELKVSGQGSGGAFFSGMQTSANIKGNITVKGKDAIGLVAGGHDQSDEEMRCNVTVEGNIIAPTDAVNANDGAYVAVLGNVETTENGASAISVVGAIVEIGGNVTSKGIGINASKWELGGPNIGANVTINGRITAKTPIVIGGVPFSEEDHSEQTTNNGYLTYKDDINNVWVKVYPIKTVTNPTSGVTLEYADGSDFESNYNLSVEKKTEDINQYKHKIKKAIKGYTLSELYDITLTQDGTAVQPGGKVKITIPLTEELKKLSKLGAVLIDDEGNIKKLESEIKDGKIIITAEHFSLFGIISEDKSGGNFPLIPVVAGAIAVVLIATGVVMLSKSKRKNLK